MGGNLWGQGPLWAKNPILIFLKFFKVKIKNSSPIPAKTAEIIVLSLILGPHGFLNRIQRIQRKRNMRCGTDPGFPTPGARMTVVTQTPSNYCFISCQLPRLCGRAVWQSYLTSLYGTCHMTKPYGIAMRLRQWFLPRSQPLFRG